MTSTSESLVRELALFAEVELGELPGQRAMRLAAGDELCRQGQPADALYVVEEGSVVVAARLPGEREIELATLGPRGVVGELALLDGGVRSATVRALEPTRVLRLTRRQFAGLISREDGGARSLRRRLTRLACTRLRERHLALAALLRDQPLGATEARLDSTRAPARSYLLRLPFFRDYEDGALDELLERARIARVAPGSVLVAEDEPPPALFVTLQGAVDEAIRRERSAIRVSLAGPGRGFGYAGLILGQPATATAAARERSTVLVVEPSEVDALLASNSFATAIEHDVVGALRQAERPQARLAAAGAWQESGP